MIAYASRTGTRRNLAALREAGWRLIVTPVCLRTEGFRYALDNGAWSAHRRGLQWDADAFVRALVKLGMHADFVVLPDIVGQGTASLKRSRTWLPIVSGYTGRCLVPVQNGVDPAEVRALLSERVGLFVGGDTTWKLATLGYWGRMAHEAGCYLHVGRVNTARRIRRVESAGAHSFDGTSVTRYAETLRALEEARQQRGFRLYA